MFILHHRKGLKQNVEDLLQLCALVANLCCIMRGAEGPFVVEEGTLSRFRNGKIAWAELKPLLPCSSSA